MLYFITGGARSGKSSFGQTLALELSNNPIYLATSRIWDDDHRARIARHKADRDDRWTNIEEEKYLSRHNFEDQTVLVECVTLWLNNFFVDNGNDVEQSLTEAKSEFLKLTGQNANFIIISNELGMGVHAESEAGRKFTDLQGWMNQFIAAKADEVYLMVSGIPVKVK
jgi:adenosylcobinamide kinase/adenosylcobinamide-phosphate guanylyltransferase